LKKEKIIEILKTNYPILHSKYGVKKIGLFGSYARDESKDTSDVDIVVEFDQPIGFRFMELSEYLEDLLGKNVDVLTPAGIQGIRSANIA